MITLASCNPSPKPCRILEEEDNLIAAHRWQIEETMAIVRQEMNLLGQVQRIPLSPHYLK